MYFNGSSFIYNRPVASKVEQIEYAEMKHVQTLAKRVAILEDRESKIVKQVDDNRQNIEGAVDQIRDNYAAMNDLNMRLEALENAPRVTKRRRRVTICAS